MQAGSGLGIVLTRVLFPATIVLEPKFLYCLDFIFRGSVVDWQTGSGLGTVQNGVMFCQLVCCRNDI